MNRLEQAHIKYLDLQAAYDVLVARKASVELRREMLDIVSDAHRAYYLLLLQTMSAAGAGVIPERSATA